MERDGNRTYALDKIKELKVLKEAFRKIPDIIDENIWFSG